MPDSKLNETLKIKPVKYLVHAKATYYPTFVRIYIPNQPYAKDVEGYERPISKSTSLTKVTSEFDETDVERSIRRTRKKIKDHILCNEFDLFATFTFKDDRQNIDRCKTRMAGWLKNQRARVGKFSYIIVPEFHKDKQSLHFHALLGGYKGRLEQSQSPTGQPIKQGGHFVYELPSYTLGFTNVKIIDKKADSQTKVGFYIQKYITKGMPLFFGKNRYWASKSLTLPKTEDNPEKWYKQVTPDREYPNDNGIILEFDKKSSPLTEMYLEAKQ